MAAVNPLADNGQLQEVRVDDDPTRTHSYHTALASTEKAASTTKKGDATAAEKKDGNKGDEMASFNELWRYASKRDKALFWVACICSLTQGAGMPLWTILFGKLSHVLHAQAHTHAHACTRRSCCSPAQHSLSHRFGCGTHSGEMINELTSSEEDLVSAMENLLWIGVVSGAGLGLLAGTAVFLFDTVGAAVAIRTREEYVGPTARRQHENALVAFHIFVLCLFCCCCCCCRRRCCCCCCFNTLNRARHHKRKWPRTWCFFFCGRAISYCG